MAPRTTLRTVAAGLAGGGGAILIIGLFLAWDTYGGHSYSAFKIFSRDDVVMLIVAVAAIALAGAALFVRWPGLTPLAGAFGLMTFGWLFLLGLEYKFKDFGAGYFIALISTGAIVAGGITAFVDLVQAPGSLVSGDQETRKQPQPVPIEAAAPTELAPPAPAGQPPAGWYPDPWGQARLRYWSGEAWTPDTQT